MAPRRARSTPSSDTDILNNDAPRDDLAEMKAQMAELQGRLSSAEADLGRERTGRAAAEQKSMSEAERRLRAELNSSDTLLESMASEADTIEGQIAALSDLPGNGKEIAALTRKLSVLSARTETETGRKAWLNGEVEKAKAAPAREAAPAAGEVLASGVKLSTLSPKVQAWFRARPKAFTDSHYLDKVIAAANYAANVKGIPVESDPYFLFVEQETGEATQRQPVEHDDEGDDLGIATADSPYSQTAAPAADLDQRVERPQPRAAGPGSMAAATPPSRSVPVGAGGRPSNRQPLLSSDQREAADGLYGHITDPKERYLKYADNLERVKHRIQRGSMEMN